MTKALMVRLGLLVLIVWLLGALMSWLVFNPGDTLVGAKAGRGGTAPIYRLLPSDLSEAADVLNNTLSWGVRRDGSPLSPPASKRKDVEEKKIEWRILAAVGKAKERYVVIQLDKNDTVVLREGDSLPDGSVLLKISPKVLKVRISDDEQKTIILNF